MIALRPNLRRLLAVPAVVLTLAGVTASSAAQDDVRIPEFTATGVLNMPAVERPLGALEGRLVLLTFLNTWSDHCVAAVPHLNKVHDRLSGRGLTILAVTEGMPDQVRPWVEEHGVRFAFATLGALDNEALRNALTVPGDPHAALVSPGGKVLWTGHPQALKEPAIRSHLNGIKAPPPRLPEALTEQQALLGDGRWAAARSSLESAMEGLDAVARDWARGLVEWIDERRGTWLEEAAALVGAGRHWDAWEMYVDFGRRFEGLAGGDDAAAAAAAIRADPQAAKDLAAGDDVAKAREFLAAGKTRQAELMLNRVVRQAKGTVHVERAQALLAGLR